MSPRYQLFVLPDEFVYTYYGSEDFQVSWQGDSLEEGMSKLKDWAYDPNPVYLLDTHTGVRYKDR